ncbi:DUF3224 domain-containing protein [Streptomyces sp. cmx-4-9]|uniref:DUF3224 domain-containing protein n=1 Tax=Streptomyces sp. cmx-4-9 TaxID=2790941 RepID=UPI00397F5250
MPTSTSGTFTFADWEESPVGAADASPRLARAQVRNTFTGGIEAARTHCAYTIAYAAGNSGSFAGMELVAGSVGGRTGAFVLEERGTFDASGTTRCTFEVVPGSATGDLAGLTGSGSFTARHGEASVAYAFTHDLPRAGRRPAQPAGRATCEGP